MIVTPPDSHIARYAVRKLARSLHESLHLCIYFNGLNPNLQRRIRQHVQGNPYVQLKDNYAQIAENREAIAAQVGKVMVTANGHACELREGLYEPQAEIWSRELVRFTEFDLAGIVDPDFEILEPDFIAGIQGAFADDERLGFFSTNYSPTVEFYDSYSREHCILEQRYHTWFCLYRRRALELESDFYFYEERGGKVRKWDHSARLQEKLHSVHGFSGRALAPERKTEV
jgi:hypothetical protein